MFNWFYQKITVQKPLFSGIFCMSNNVYFRSDMNVDYLHDRKPIRLRGIACGYFLVAQPVSKKTPPDKVYNRCVGILLICNTILSLLLYELVLERFDIDTSGFINLNGVFTTGAIWSIMCLISLMLVGKIKARLGSYHKTLHVTLIIFVLLFLAGLK
ncbi:hypothetical protein [Sinomicrobium sp. M5D2P9]